MKFFKDQSFALFFLYDELQFCTNDIPDMIVDKSGNSLVIAARGGEQTDGIHILDNGKHLIKGNNPENGWLDIYLATNHLTNEEKNNIFQNKQDLDSINHVISLGSSKFVKHLVILAYSDGTECENTPDPCIIKSKVGGPEIVAEFMLSKFINNFRRLTNEQIERGEIPTQIEYNNNTTSSRKYTFDFSLAESLAELDPTDDSNVEVEMDGSVWGEAFSRYQFNINNDAVNKLAKELTIPDRVFAVLTQEQKETLKNQIPEILTERMDFIGREIFGQKFPSYESYIRHLDSIARSRSWDQSMSDLLGAEGRYLGNGISYNSDGTLED